MNSISRKVGRLGQLARWVNWLGVSQLSARVSRLPAKVSRLPARGQPAGFMCDLQLRTAILLCPNSVSGVLGLYGKPIESRFQPYACEGQWVNITFLKSMFFQGCWRARAGYSCEASNFGRP